MEERERLKKFMQETFDFYGLKEIGFWPKGIRVTDYEKQAERIRIFFSLKSIYDWQGATVTSKTATTINGIASLDVTETGVKQDGGFHFDIAESEFSCPICGCFQEVSNKAMEKISATIKCKGCKRKLCMHSSMNGKLTITEI